MVLMYETSNTLYHHGVKGMKWGQRRAQNRVAKADKNINRLTTLKKNNKNIYNTMQSEARTKYAGKDKKLKNTLAKNKTEYDRTETINNYRIARQKAKKDPSYKNSNEYIKAKAKYSKQLTQDILYGQYYSKKIDTLQNKGLSEKQAKSRVRTENALVMIGSYAVGAAIGYAANK